MSTKADLDDAVGRLSITEFVSIARSFGGDPRLAMCCTHCKQELIAERDIHNLPPFWHCNTCNIDLVAAELTWVWKLRS